MAKTVPMDRLADEIQSILKEYQDDVVKDTDTAIRKTAQAGARTLRAESKAKFNGSGRYAKGWKVKVEKKRLGTEAIIHNASVPGLPHLLEKGHANRGGGRTYPPVPGRAHIAPVEEKIVRDFEKEIEVRL